MIKGGNATLYVADMDRAVRFYTEKLGLSLKSRSGNEWAEVDAGDGMVIGLHPAGPHSPRPGSHGATQIGLNVQGDLESEVARLRKQGVKFHGDIKSDPGIKLAFLEDVDGNTLYLCQTAKA